MNPSKRGALRAVTIVLTTVLALSACSSGGRTTKRQAETSVVTTTAAATTLVTSGSPPAQSTSTTPPAATTPATPTQVPVPRAAACLASALTVSVNQLSSHESGHNGLLLRFTNTGAPACTLTGFPGVAGVDQSGRLLANAAQDTAGTPGVTQVFLVGRSGHADALINWSSVGASGTTQCASVAPAIAVTPPNTTSTTIYRNPVGLCSFKIHPVYES